MFGGKRHIGDGYLVDLITLSDLRLRLQRQVRRRNAMKRDGGYVAPQFALIDRCIDATVHDLVDLGAGDELLRRVRGEP